jgi:protein CpxP
MRKQLLLIASLALLAGAAQAQSSASQLHDALHLTVSQEDSWRSYQSAVTNDPDRQARAQQAAAMLPNLPTPRRLALIRAQMQADLNAFDRTAQAASAFYAVLTPDQQNIFDKQTAPPARTSR